MHAFRFVVPHALVYWRRYLAGLVLVPVSVLTTLAVPWLTGECVERLSGPSISPDRLAGPVIEIIAVAAAGGLALFAVRWLIIGASRHVEYDLRDRVFAHLQSLDSSFYRKARTGDVLSRITSDVERVRLLVGPIVLYSARTLLMLSVGLPLMLTISPTLTLLVMVPLSLVTAAVRWIGPRVHRQVLSAQEALADVSSLAQEAFSGIRVVKSFAREEAESERFSRAAGRYAAHDLHAARLSAWMMPLVTLVGEIGLVCLLLVGGWLILRGKIDYGDFVKFAGYQIALLWPMLSIGWVVNQYHRARASVKRLRELLEREPRVSEPRFPIAPPSGEIRGHVSIRGLRFGYDGRAVLEDVRLEAPAGSTVAILGRTGSGKSTLLGLIPRVLPPPDGAVFVDGVDVNRLPLGTLRGAIGYVPQESFLFSRTLRENVGFGRDAAELEEVISASSAARLEKDIDQFPRAFDQMVGERGVTLSGGQKQRAALARALLIRPRILLLDDALSAVDTGTEEEILSSLPAATRDATVIVVSHRVSSIARADRIYVLDEGRVAEEGTHEELLERGGIYAEIHHLQELSDELDRL